MGKRAHVIAVPFPAQGHVKPLMKLAYKIASHGIKVTFVNIETIHEKLFTTTSVNVEEHRGVAFTWIPSGSREAEGKKEIVDIMKTALPGYLTELIGKINTSERDEQITCIIADATMGWILEVGELLGLQQVAFFAASVENLAFVCHIPELIQTEKMDTAGQMMRGHDVISLSEDIPPWEGTGLPWSFFQLVDVEKTFYEVYKTAQETVDRVKWYLCNSSYEIEPAAFKLVPEILPIGPLLETDAPRTSAAAGNFWLEDASCLNWLDNQPNGSVVYVSFGSIASITQDQITELALGLEISGQPFLWVVRSDLANGTAPVYPQSFLERISDRGKIVEWAPQEKVLAHPSVACFLTHCGWNSTIECLSRGMPLLCWPSFGDQFHNESQICDIWKAGLRINQDENGLRSRDEIKIKILLMLSDENLKANALKLKKLAEQTICQEGSSFKNFEKFIIFLKS